MTFFRYPGGKSRIKEKIIEKLNSMSCSEYREPFLGAGNIGLNYLFGNPNVKNVWFNDRDPGIASLWISVINFPDELKEKVLNFQPSIENFFQFKEELSSRFLFPKLKEEFVSIGFKKLAIHQISYSGLGTKSGSPLGGINQNSNYKINCRWSAKGLCKKIDRINSKLKKFQFHWLGCSDFDFSVLLKDSAEKVLTYLDPPYYIKGNQLYEYGLSEDRHVELANLLKDLNHVWLLSYDDCPQVRKLYSWAKIEEIDVNYTITGSRDKKELLIYAN